MANAMKDWAIEKGATHYTHWFQPMTGITAEKHDSPSSPPTATQVIMEFSGKELVKGEPDASSFPSRRPARHLRGPRLHRLGPDLLRLHQGRHAVHPHRLLLLYRRGAGQEDPAAALDAGLINDQALRILRLFGKTDVNSVTTTVGAEQEYFLVDKADFDKRPGPDLHRPDAVRRAPAQGPGAGRPLLRRAEAARGRVHARSGRGAVEAGHPGQDRAQRGRPRAARAGPDLRQHQRGHRPQPADHGDHAARWPRATAWSACCTRSPSPGSTAAASTTTGQCPPTPA